MSTLSPNLFHLLIMSVGVCGCGCGGGRCVGVGMVEGCVCGMGGGLFCTFELDEEWYHKIRTIATHKYMYALHQIDNNCHGKSIQAHHFTYSLLCTCTCA